MVNASGVVEFRDFGLVTQPKSFKIYVDDPFMFDAVPAMPLGVMTELLQIEDLDISKGIEPIIEFFDKVLLPDSAVEFKKRLTTATRWPIDLTVMRELLNWFVEVYALRPTQPSPPSSNGSADDGSTSSTAGASLEVSTLSSLNSLGSSTSFITTPPSASEPS